MAKSKDRECAEKGLNSKLRDYNIKANINIPENELEQRLTEIEEKRRQSLTIWHQNVMALHGELWQMSEDLEDSLVKEKGDDTAARIKHSLLNNNPSHDMTSEELDRLPVLMRPRPKYPPDKNMFTTKTQLRERNDRSFAAQIDRLKNDPPLDGLGKGDNERSTLISASGERLPSLKLPPFFDILNLKPKQYNHRELTLVLERSDTTVRREKKKKKRCTCRDKAQEAFQPKEEKDEGIKAGQAGDMEYVPTAPKTTAPQTARISSRTLSPRKLTMKAQSVPDLLQLNLGESRVKGTSESVENLSKIGEKGNQKDLTSTNDKKVIGEAGEGANDELDGDLSDLIDASEMNRKNKKPHRRPDKLDDLADKEFRRRLISHYSKQREHRNEKTFVDSMHGEKHSFIKIKFSDIVNNAPKHITQDRILKRLSERSGVTNDEEKATDKEDAETAKDNNQNDTPYKERVLPRINPRGYPGCAGMTGHDIEFKPKKLINFPSIKDDSHATASEDNSKENSFVNFNNNNIGEAEQAQKRKYQYVIPSSKDESMMCTSSDSITGGIPMPTNVQSTLSSFSDIDFFSIKDHQTSTPLQSAPQSATKRFSRDNILNDTESLVSSVFHQDEKEREGTGENKDEEATESVFDGDVKDCKYLRGYDPPDMRKVDNISDYVFDGKEELKLKRVSFFHPGQFKLLHDVVVEEDEATETAEECK